MEFRQIHHPQIHHTTNSPQQIGTNTANTVQPIQSQGHVQYKSSKAIQIVISFFIWVTKVLVAGIVATT